MAERSGIIADIIGGTGSGKGYALLLRNLLPAYDAMESRLDALRGSSGLGELAMPEIYRAAALRSDLAALGGADWAATLPLLPAGERYAERVVAAAAGARLIGHVYVRYLGDLNGGQILKRRLAGSLGLPPRALGFYDFPAIADLGRFAADYRRALGRAADRADFADIADEAAEAFRHNIQVSEEVKRAAI
jgi:heme oxygenase